MGFFNSLGRLLGGGRALSPDEQKRLSEAWKLYGESEAAEPRGSVLPPPSPDADSRERGSAASAYDTTQWRKKLKTILDRLPESKPDWEDLMADVGPLGLRRDWVEKCLREEFELLVRRAVADAKVTREEHEKLDLARSLIGLSEDDADRILNSVVAEAESFFGRTIRGTAG